MPPPDNAHAAPDNPLKENPNPKITISSDKAAFKITDLEPDGPAKIDSENITITTDNPTGYMTTLSVNSSTETCLRRLSDGSNCGDAVNAFTSASGTMTSPSLLSLSTLSSNQWGASLATAFSADPSQDSTWFKIPSNASSSIIDNSNIAVPSGKTTKLTIGAKMGYAFPMTTVGDEYKNTLLITASTNAYAIPPVPTITGISPSIGPLAGGTTITINGNNLDTAYQVFIDLNSNSNQDNGEACTNANIVSNTQITCQAPAVGAVATYDVVVKTWGGATKTATGTTATTADNYNYQSPITVSFVSPSIASTTPGTEHGPAFSIVGTNFSGATGVSIGGVACQSFIVTSNTLIECTGPNSSLSTGSKSVVVTKGAVVSNSTINVAYNATAYPTLQSPTAYASCPPSPTIFRDTRDSQLYYVKRMADEKCWMVDNLKYVSTTIPNTVNSTTGMTLNYGQMGEGYNTIDGNYNTANIDNQAFYNSPMGTAYCIGNADMPAYTVTRCGYLYNWYAATNGTSSSAPYNVQAASSICPSGFRLPSISSGPAGANTDPSGSVGYDQADFPVLNASMLNNYLTSGSRGDFAAGWQPSGAWQGVYSGVYTTELGGQMVAGGAFYWSSTSYDNTQARAIWYNHLHVDVYESQTLRPRHMGYAVRCVKEGPLVPPDGTNPSNLSATNPPVLDVYPTTGWRREVISITSNALFTNVQNVTIGGTACVRYEVTSTSRILCKLPDKTAGTTHDIAVINNGVNITNAATYNHMKITYFNSTPGISTVSIGGASYTHFPSSFTAGDCSYLTASNSTSDSPNSVVYVRDVRNGQTYRVKRMIDGKCWMIDNLKYIDTTVANSADGTTGMVYNNGDHLGNGGSNAANVVNENYNSNYSAANFDKAFYNNPMGTAYCYGTANMPTNTLTRCGYLYNWYAATAGDGRYNSSGQINGDICPAGFSLPSAIGNYGISTSSDFPVLNASMNTGSLQTGATTQTYFANWLPGGAWQGVYSGYYANNGLANQNVQGHYWSSSNQSNSSAHGPYFTSSNVVVNSGNNEDLKPNGRAVRCVLVP